MVPGHAWWRLPETLMLDQSHTPASLASPVLTRREAAQYCRVSLSTFERHIQPQLAPHPGRRPRPISQGGS